MKKRILSVITALCPSLLPTAALAEGEDYTLSGTTSASAVGTHTLTVTGTGDYSGSVAAERRIEGAAPTNGSPPRNDALPPAGRVKS